MRTEVRVADREGHISQHEVVVDIGRGRSRDITSVSYTHLTLPTKRIV